MCCGPNRSTSLVRPLEMLSEERWRLLNETFVIYGSAMIAFDECFKQHI